MIKKGRAHAIIEKNKPVIILTSTNHRKTAIQIVQTLLKDKLIACGKIIENVESSYWWRGQIEKENEFQVILKTVQRNFEQIHDKISKIHSYQVPELIAIQVLKASPHYLTWLKKVIE